MQRDPKVVLHEILDVGDIAIGICANMSLERFRSSKVEKFAVERAIEIISEAARHLPETELERYPTIPWRQVKAMGNILRYEYHRLNDEVIWGVARNDLPDLMAKLRDGNPDLRSGTT